MGSRLTIVFPDLFDLIAEHSDRQWEQQFPSLYRLMSVGEIIEQAEPSLEHKIAACFPIEQPQLRQLSIAQLSGEYELQTPTQNLLRCDPVHLRADGGHLRLDNGLHCAPSIKEADAIIGYLNETLEDCKIVRGKHPARWYLETAAPLSIKTYTPNQVAGASIDQFLPGGKDAKFVHRLMNDVQMLCHQSAVNQAREADGVAQINSVWIWGEGDLESDKVLKQTAKLDQAFGDDLLTCVLSQHLAVPWKQNASDANTQSGGAQRHTLVVLDSPTGPTDNAAVSPTQLFDFEKNWCVPLLKRLRSWQLGELQITTRRQLLRVRPLDSYKFWKRSDYFVFEPPAWPDPDNLPRDVDINDPHH